MKNQWHQVKMHFNRVRSNFEPRRESPDELLGELFQDVQFRRIYPDSLTFVDMVPAAALRRILSLYKKARHDPDFDLLAFVQHHFKDYMAQSDYATNPRHTVEEHIEELWGVLQRDVPTTTGSLIGMPYPYVVAGGRFRAMFYWDSYFTMLGLVAGGHWGAAENMVKDCAFLIRKFGHVPNGNRTYYASRSQPPVFALMVRLLSEKKGKSTLIKYLPYMITEYRFWMQGAKSLSGQRPAYRRTVWLPGGYVLNRYYDNKCVPRPEGYKEDVQIALEAPDRTPSKVYLDLRAGAESGWDFSTRWLKDPQKLATIHTTDIIPVDLNCILHMLELTIADAYLALKQKGRAAKYTDRARLRAEAINHYCWNDKEGFYFDYDFVTQKQTSVMSMAAVFPLFARISSPAQAKKVADVLRTKFLKNGGLVTTTLETGQQWDAPNGWAPLQWVAVQGLRAYEQNSLADDVKQRWVSANIRHYKATGKLVEKYNVVDLDRPAGGGEYVLQDGFGWTNGVLLALLKETEVK